MLRLVGSPSNIHGILFQQHVLDSNIVRSVRRHAVSFGREFCICSTCIAVSYGREFCICVSRIQERLGILWLHFVIFQVKLRFT